jgi:hypothetical protein
MQYRARGRADPPVVQTDKGGNPDVVRESQKKRGASVELVDEVIAIFAEHKQGMWICLLCCG